jgi:hypothetical protein
MSVLFFGTILQFTLFQLQSYCEHLLLVVSSSNVLQVILDIVIYGLSDLLGYSIMIPSSRNYTNGQTQLYVVY